MFSGFYPALLTPYDSDGNVSVSSMEKHVDSLIAQGADGFYVNGSTGEGLMLSESERRIMAEAVVSASGGKAKVIVQVGSLSLEESCRLAEHAASIGCDGVSSLPPLYYKYSFEQIKQFYKRLGMVSDLPLIVYNIPSYSGVSLSVAQISELAAAVPTMAGIKHSSPNLYELERFKRHLPQFDVFYGMDEQYLGAKIMGADAAIGSTYNVMLPLYLRLNTAPLDKATAMQIRINDLIEESIKNDLMPTFKYFLEKEGIPFGGCREPMCSSLSDAQKKVADNIFEKLKREQSL